MRTTIYVILGIILGFVLGVIVDFFVQPQMNNQVLTWVLMAIGVLIGIVIAVWLSRRVTRHELATPQKVRRSTYGTGTLIAGLLFVLFGAATDTFSIAVFVGGLFAGVMSLVKERGRPAQIWMTIIGLAIIAILTIVSLATGTSLGVFPFLMPGIY